MKPTDKEIQDNTFWTKRYHERLKKKLLECETDSGSIARLHLATCKVCYYLRGGLAGQAFTSYTCKGCGDVHQHPNTDVPQYCKQCSERYHICIRCGGTLD